MNNGRHLIDNISVLNGLKCVQIYKKSVPKFTQIKNLEDAAAFFTPMAMATSQFLIMYFCTNLQPSIFFSVFASVVEYFNVSNFHKILLIVIPRFR